MFSFPLRSVVFISAELGLEMSDYLKRERNQVTGRVFDEKKKILSEILILMIIIAEGDHVTEDIER